MDSTTRSVQIISLNDLNRTNYKLFSLNKLLADICEENDLSQKHICVNFNPFN